MQEENQTKDIKIYTSDECKKSYVHTREQLEKNKPIKTGLPSLDDMLGGGLRAGLTVCAAGSSYGKTALAGLIADNIAESGRDVLFVCLEMSRVEMISRSISRYAYTMSNHKSEITAAGVLLDNREEYTEYDAATITRAEEHYFTNVAPHIYYMEGIGDITAQDISAAIRAFASGKDIKPACFVDYLQIIGKDEVHMNERQQVDAAVIELKKVTRDADVPIWLVSSINRTNYYKSISFEALKESGAIEYTADVVIGMQFFGQGMPAKKDKGKIKVFGTDTSRWNSFQKDKNVRRIHIKLMKHRQAPAIGGANLKYYPAYNLFEIADETDVKKWRTNVGMEKRNSKEEEKLEYPCE